MHRRKNERSFDEDFLDALSGKSSREGGRRGRRPDYKTLQLCRAAQRALSLALAGECGDDVLRSMYVQNVVPAPDATRLLARLITPRTTAARIDDIYVRLERARPLLRRAVTEAVTRKRAPELSFVVTPEVSHE